MRDLLKLDDLKGKKMKANREEAKGALGKLRAFFFFFRKKLMDFINKIQLHPIVKSNQYEMGHLPSILENLVCIMHF